MTVLTIIAIAAGVTLLYTYLGYLLIMYTWRNVRGLREYEPEVNNVPTVSLIVAAYNEQDCIEDKIRNSIQLEYPADKFEVIVVTDGSSDATSQIVDSFPNVVHLHSSLRRGKLHAMARATKVADGEIVIYTDANAMLNKEAVEKIVECFNDSTVGAVSGEKRVIDNISHESAAFSEGLYWRYESLLKQLDSDIHSVVGAAGELFAIRAELHEDVPTDTILDDFMITLGINVKGYRTAYTSEAFAMEAPSFDLKSEYNRKVRIAAGGWQAMSRLTHLLNPLKHGILSVQYISRRVARWAIAPLALPLLLLSTGVLAVGGIPWAQWLLVGQALFYGVAIIGWIRGGRATSIERIAFYFTFMHVCALVGMVSFFRGSTSVKWQKAKRLSMPSILD